MASLFDYINGINNKNYNFSVEESKDYNNFIVTKAFSYYIDTIFVANEINRFNVSKKQHYDFLYHIVDKKKRYAKWHKAEEDDALDIITEYYNVRYDKAKEILNILTEDQVQQIKEKLEKGGR